MEKDREDYKLLHGNMNMLMLCRCEHTYLINTHIHMLAEAVHQNSPSFLVSGTHIALGNVNLEHLILGDLRSQIINFGSIFT